MGMDLGVTERSRDQLVSIALVVVTVSSAWVIHRVNSDALASLAITLWAPVAVVCWRRRLRDWEFVHLIAHGVSYIGLPYVVGQRWLGSGWALDVMVFGGLVLSVFDRNRDLLFSGRASSTSK